MSDAGWRELRSRVRALDMEEAFLEFSLRRIEEETAAYETFHWGDDVDGALVVEMPPTPAMIAKLGELRTVVYRTRKSGQLYDWEHDFRRTRPSLAYGPTGHLYIVGGDYRVTEAGIVG